MQLTNILRDLRDREDGAIFVGFIATPKSSANRRARSGSLRRRSPGTAAQSCRRRAGNSRTGRGSSHRSFHTHPHTSIRFHQEFSGNEKRLCTSPKPRSPGPRSPARAPPKIVWRRRARPSSPRRRSPRRRCRRCAAQTRTPHTSPCGFSRGSGPNAVIEVRRRFAGNRFAMRVCLLSSQLPGSPDPPAGPRPPSGSSSKLADDSPRAACQRRRPAPTRGARRARKHLKSAHSIAPSAARPRDAKPATASFRPVPGAPPRRGPAVRGSPARAISKRRTRLRRTTDRASGHGPARERRPVTPPSPSYLARDQIAQLLVRAAE